MALAQVAVWRPRPGRFTEFLGVCQQAKKIHQRLGAQVRTWQAQIGHNTGTIAYVTQFSDGGGYGEFIDKLNGDGEWQQLVASFLADPSAEIEQSNLLQELP